MTQSFRSFKPRRFTAGSAPRAAKPRPKQPVRTGVLPAAVVDAVLRYHDQNLDQGAGRTLLRLSRERLADAEVALALGPDAIRAAGVSILWSEREGQIIRVLEDLEPRLAA